MNNKVVYAFLRPDDTPFYIGMGSISRARDHSKGSRNWRWWEEMKKYKNDYKFIIVDRSLTREQAYEIEIDLISKFGRKELDKNGILTNISPGGGWIETKAVVQFDLDGNKIREYLTMNEATSAYPDKNPIYQVGAICMVCQGKRMRLGDYQWFYKSEIGDINYVGGISHKRKPSFDPGFKKKCKDIDGSEFESLSDHARYVLQDKYYPGSYNRKDVKDRRIMI